MKIRFGTRGSPLARVQTGFARKALLERRPDLEVEVVIVKTEGDARHDAPIAALGAGAFTKELEDALLDARCDLAVHSLKDLPTSLAPGLALAAVLPRADPRDALCARGDSARSLADLPRGARVGTSSPRRAGQLLAARPDLRLEPLRGNVDTRLGRVALDPKDPRALDAVVLARAGLDRLGRSAGHALPLDVVLPAPGQAAIALESRAGDAATLALAGLVDDAPTREATLAERLLHQALGGGCRAPVGAHATIGAGRIELRACVAALDGSRVLRASATAASAKEVADLVARDLMKAGAAEVLADARAKLGASADEGEAG